MNNRWLTAFFAMACAGCATASRPAAAVDHPVTSPMTTPGAVVTFSTPVSITELPQVTDFNLTTAIDLSASGVAPQTLATLAEFAQAFVTSPGHAVLDAAAAAKVPGLHTLVAALPRSLEKRLADLLDRAMVANKSSANVKREVAAIAELAAQVLGTIELESELASEAGRHTARRVAIVVRGERVAVPVVVVEKVGASAAVLVKRNGTAMQIEEHRLGVRLGTTLWSLLEHASVKQTGLTPGQRISRALACADVATRVAATCIAKVCVGHSPAVQEVCDAGGQAAIAKVQAQFVTLDYDALIFRQGEATLDTDAMNVHGTWKLLLDVGMGPRQARATFCGVAQPTTP